MTNERFCTTRVLATFILICIGKRVFYWTLFYIMVIHILIWISLWTSIHTSITHSYWIWYICRINQRFQLLLQQVKTGTYVNFVFYFVFTPSLSKPKLYTPCFYAKCRYFFVRSDWKDIVFFLSYRTFNVLYITVNQ